MFYLPGIKFVHRGGFQCRALEEDGGGELREVHGVGDEARFQAKAAVRAQLPAVLACLDLGAGVGVEHHGGHIGVGPHPAAHVVAVKVRHGLAGLLLIQQIKFVVAHGAVAEVVPAVLHGLADAPEVCKVRRRAPHGHEAAVGDALRVPVDPVGRADPQVVVPDVAGTGEVEVGVVGGVEDGVALGGKLILDGQARKIVEAIPHPGLGAALEAHGGVVEVVQDHALALDAAGPELLAVVVLRAVEEVLPLVADQLEFLPPDGEFAPLDAVGHAADDAPGPAEVLDALAAGAPQAHVAQRAGAVLHHDGVDYRAVLDDLHVLALFVSDGEPADLTAVPQLPVDIRCDHCRPSPAKTVSHDTDSLSKSVL